MNMLENSKIHIAGYFILVAVVAFTAGSFCGDKVVDHEVNKAAETSGTAAAVIDAPYHP